MPTVVQAGEPVGYGQLVELAVRVSQLLVGPVQFAPYQTQTLCHVVERFGHRPQLAATEHGELYHEIPGSDLCRTGRQAVEWPYDRDAEQIGDHENDDQN